MALQSIALYCSNSCYSLKIRTVLLKSMHLFLFQLETFYCPKRTELRGGEDNSCLQSCQQKVALRVAQAESMLPNLLGVACNLHWGQAKLAVQQRAMARRVLPLGQQPFRWLSFHPSLSLGGERSP